jgi:outer membrane protein assembly factor BamE (lipoprotein component of BamABCDE complex)
MFPVTISKAIAVAALAGAALLAGCAGNSVLGGGATRSAEQFAQIQRGMTSDEVRRLAGPPDDTMPFPLSHTQSWGYRYQDPWGYLAEFSVTYDADGRVLSTFSRRINEGGDHSR